MILRALAAVLTAFGVYRVLIWLGGEIERQEAFKWGDDRR